MDSVINPKCAVDFDTCDLGTLAFSFCHLITMRCPRCSEYSLCVPPHGRRLRCSTCGHRLEA